MLIDDRNLCLQSRRIKKRHFPLFFPPVFFILLTGILRAQPETVGTGFGIIVLIFPNVLSDCG